jgi:hypothetical protein
MICVLGFLPHDTDKRNAFLNMLMNFQFFTKCRKFLEKWTATGFPKYKFFIHIVKTVKLIKVNGLSTCLKIAISPITNWGGPPIILAEVCLLVGRDIFTLVSTVHCKLPVIPFNVETKLQSRYNTFNIQIAIPI